MVHRTKKVISVDQWYINIIKMLENNDNVKPWDVHKKGICPICSEKIESVSYDDENGGGTSFWCSDDYKHFSFES